MKGGKAEGRKGGRAGEWESGRVGEWEMGKKNIEHRMVKKTESIQEPGVRMQELKYSDG